jgi:tellurium resistance protein TerD
MLQADGTLPDDSYFVFYNNLRSGDGSVLHNGDNRTGSGDGDSETIDLDLNKVSPEIVQICFTISINNADAGFNFSNVTNANVRVIDLSTQNILCEYLLNESFPDADTLNIGRLYRYDNDWNFEALGDAYNGGLEATLSSIVPFDNESSTEQASTQSNTFQQQLADEFCRSWPEGVVKKIDKDNFLDIHIPSVNPKTGTHLGFNTSKNQIKICFYCRDKEFNENALSHNSEIEAYSSGLRPLNNPTFTDIHQGVQAAIQFLKNIKQ